MNKVENGLSPVVFSEIFSIRHQKRLNLRQNLDFAVPSIKSFSHGFESLLYLGPKIWESIPSNVREKHFLRKVKDGENLIDPSVDCAKSVYNMLDIYSLHIYVIIYCLPYHVFPIFKNILYIEHAA